MAEMAEQILGYRDELPEEDDPMRAQIEAAARIMEGCACYMWITEQVKFADENLMYNLSNYINLHLSEDLSVERLCDIFQISRSTLYKITNTYMDRHRRVHTQNAHQRGEKDARAE